MNLPYGKSTLGLKDRWHGRARWVAPGPFRTAESRVVVEKALDEPIDSPALEDLGLTGKRIACVVPDLSRRAAVDAYLPVLLPRLLSVGVKAEDVCIVVALGIHRPLEKKELRELVGRETWARFRVVNHDPEAEEGNIALGVTTGGIRVEVNREVAMSDRIILTGGITYHYFAGYGGGRKALFPGVASRRSCEAHHRIVVSWRRKEISGSIAPGVLDANPIHREMMEACTFAPPIYLLNVVTDPQGRIIGAFSGDLNAAHLRACRMHDDFYRRAVPELSKLVIASAGGYPKDVNFVQAHKGLHGAHMAVADGGVVVLLAECLEGPGHKNFFSWFVRCSTEEGWLRELERSYQINGQTAFSTWLKVRRSPTILVSRLDPDEVRVMGMVPAESMEEALDEAKRVLGDLPVPIILPHAADTLTSVKGR
jgi:nickel-dependent lactate racemase